MAFDAEKIGADVRLLAGYAAGAPEAARQLTNRFLPLAYRLAARILADRAEAEDVAQEAMLRLFRAAPGWQPGQAQVSTWLYRVTANLCTDRLRKRRVLPLDDVPEMADGQRSVADVLMAADRQAALERALGHLPERQRLAVVLRHLEGLANPEIARIMEIGTEAVESLVARGKRNLKEALIGQRDALGYEDD